MESGYESNHCHQAETHVGGEPGLLSDAVSEWMRRNQAKPA